MVYATHAGRRKRKMESESKLVNSRICQSCAKCCKEYTMNLTKGVALRYKWLLGNKVKIESTPFRNKQGKQLFQITILKSCQKLKQHSTGKYYCSVWDKKRPEDCKTYPDHIFWDADSKDKEFLEEVKEYESKNCPALKEINIEKIIESIRGQDTKEAKKNA